MSKFDIGKYELSKIDQETGEVLRKIDLEVKVTPLTEPKNNVRAYASITLDGMFGTHGIKVIDGQNGLFMRMPQMSDGRGGFRDVSHPVTKEVRVELQNAVLAQYGVALGQLEAQQESTLAKIKETKEALAGKATPDKAATREPGRTPKNKADEAR